MSRFQGRYLIRVDDVCPTMNPAVWNRVEQLLHRAGIRPILAVVPDNRNPKLAVSDPDPDFWENMRRAQARGWTIALHGCTHEILSNDSGLVGLNKRSEFAGLPIAAQRERISRGLSILANQGLRPRVFAAPAHSFDSATLEVVREAGIGVINDGLFAVPGCDRLSLLWIPHQLWSLRRTPPGVWTVGLHLNGWTVADTEHFSRSLSARAARITDVDEVISTYGNRKIGLADRAVGHLYRRILLTRRAIDSVVAPTAT